ncbi:hypothetical protein DFS33DRAFT_462965 [Desarmillaria ectypa]|nr:hypothetical protein DFS33DRAFT_462965 [Desarmillaria ectypa]
MTADSKTNGFPDGYFIIRSAATKRLLDVACDAIEDGTELLLFPEKEKSLVESRRNPEANNQVFYIDTSGALCSRSSGHALDIEGDRLVLRHRRPISLPFPNSYSHPLPEFSYDLQAKEIHVNFSCDPAYPPHSASHPNAWKEKTYLLAAIPLRKPRTIIDDASQFIHSALTSSLSLFQSTSPTSSTPEDVYKGGVDLGEDEVVEEERGEEGEVDDSPEPSRKVRVLSVVNATMEDESLVEKARNRRRWQVEPLRIANKRTGA